MSGDDPFGGGAPSQDDALLNWGSDQRVGLVIAYGFAADRLVERALEVGEQDLLIYPILFLYRHHIELAIKCVLETSRAYLRQSELLLGNFNAPDIVHETKPRRYLHDLERAWADLEALFEHLDIPANDKHIAQARETVKAFTELDPKGDAFRYADGSVGAGIRDVKRIGLRNLRATAATAGNALMGLNDWLLDQVDTGNDVLADYWDDMRDYGDY